MRKKQSPEYARAYYAAHREHYAENHRKYYAEHREEILEYRLEWQRTHRENRAESNRKWAETHQEQKAEYDREYDRQHPESVAAKYWRRRARKSKTVCSLTAEDIKNMKRSGCFFADDTCRGALSIAHDVPVINGGNTTTGNTFVLCARHNSQMNTRPLSKMLTQLRLDDIHTARVDAQVEVAKLNSVTPHG